MNLTQIAQVAAEECIRQHVGLDRLVTLLNAHSLYAEYTRESLIEDGLEGLAWLGGLVEPDNHGRFRSTPVTFANGGSSASPGSIFRALDMLFHNGDALTIDEWVKEFLWIHPFADGNGRTGFIIYNIFNGTMDAPVALPKYFGES